MRIILWHPTGPLLAYDSTGCLIVEDLNPEVRIRFRLEQWEMFKIGLKFLWLSLRGPR